jgi:hypothetical protein
MPGFSIMRMHQITHKESTMSIAHTTATVIPIRTRLTSPLIFLLAASTGLSVAALYYSQPTLGVLATDLHASNRPSAGSRR